MKVAVRYMAQIKDAAGTPTEQVELDRPCSVQEFVTGLAVRHGGKLRSLLLDSRGVLHPTLLLFVGDEQVGPAQPVQLKDGDVITLLSPMAGG